jgi:Fe-S-cluster formation regulator IscX/YfhJ
MFSKKFSNIKFHEIRPVGAELFHEGGQADRETDRQTDMTKLIVAFRNFENAPKNTNGETSQKPMTSTAIILTLILNQYSVH